LGTVPSAVTARWIDLFPGDSAALESAEAATSGLAGVPKATFSNYRQPVSIDVAGKGPTNLVTTDPHEAVSGFLLDTHVISELVKPKSEAKVVEWVQATNKELLYLSVLTSGRDPKGNGAARRSHPAGRTGSLAGRGVCGPLRRPHAGKGPTNLVITDPPRSCERISARCPCHFRAGQA
jgi:hypothetical protein